MTDRPPTSGRPIAELLAGLSDERRLALFARLGSGLFNAHRAAAAVMGEGGREGATDQSMLTDLSAAIRELEAARAIVAEAAEGG